MGCRHQLCADGVPQLLNLAFGNAALLGAVQLRDVRVPASFTRAVRGPQFGVAGLRRLIDRAGPILLSAAKPIGLDSDELAARCAALARGGIDLIKDDHGLSNQHSAPFDERVARCVDAVEQANRETGGRSLFLPNVTAPLDEMRERVERARALGCRAIVVSPFLMGLDTVRWLAQTGEVAVVTHPAFGAATSAPGQGVAPRFLFGSLLRILGADGAIVIGSEGRFPVTEAEVRAIVEALREVRGTVLPTLPILGGGVDVAQAPRWAAEYGPDVGLLVGSSLYAQGDLEVAARRLVSAVRQETGGGRA
jgi:ribulose-bisphosphate carboxylase large chain